MLDFSSAPFYDDFDENNKFYSILFRPSVAVQARELNQLQTILQNQITKHGDHIFKNGTVVIPGEFSINASIDYVKLADFGNASSVTDLIGLKIQDTDGLEALVVHAEPYVSVTEPATLYVSYTKSATNTTTKIFADTSELSVVNGVYSGITVAPSSATGTGSISTIQRGVYYINGRFVLCDTQTIVLSKYSNLPTYKIGFNVIESVVTSDDVGYDSLLDNAQGSYNYAAPGAHRYYIDLVLTALAIDATSETFSELGRVANGIILSSLKNTEYSQLEKTFARRTYDESGNYTVRAFPVDVREHRNNDRGDWDNAVAYEAGDIVTNSSIKYTAINQTAAGAAAPVHTTGIVNTWEQTTYPYYNRGIYSYPDGNKDKLAIGFEPGKAYVQGYEIEKLATTYVEIDKPRNATNDVASDNNASIVTSVGSYVQVRDVHNVNSSTTPIMSTGVPVLLYDGIVTTAGTLAGTAIGTCKVRGVQTESGTGVGTYCKLFIYDVSMYAGKDFSRDVKSFYYSVAGFTANVTPDTYSVSIGVVSVTSGGVVTGSGFVNSLKSGDYVYYNSVFGKVPTTFTDTSFTLVGATGTASTGVQMYRIQTQLSEPNSSSLVFPLPHYATKTVADQNYYIIKSFNGVTAASNILTISESGSIFLPDASNYYITNSSGDSIGSAAFTVDTSIAGTAKLTFTTLVGTYNIIATVFKTSAPKSKTLTSTSDTIATFNDSTIKLTKTDCYKLVSIFMGTTEITDWYTFNDGQKDSYYDYGSITLKSSYPTPSASIVISYQYFAHGTGDYFDLNSYATIDYSRIPYYGGVNLRDAIDFRPRADSFSLSMPKRGYNMTVDTSYYLARQDKISLDISGNFFDTKGSSSLNPGMPEDSSTGMTLCTVMLAPYTFDTNDVIVTKVENKRYTMRDIGKLEKRIDNIEYYTSLSMLEQETASLSITDASGNDRFKNGFIVDNFTGHNIGDVSSADYNCAIDMERGELRPAVNVDNVNLLVDTINSTNYKMYGDLVTLPLNDTIPHVELAKNAYASRTENVNPFAVFTFLGNVKLNPSSDDWFEVNRLPDVVTKVEGNYLTTLANKSGLLGTIWNSWQNQWSGTPILTNNREIASDIRGIGVTGWMSGTVSNISSDAVNAEFGNVAGAGWAHRDISVKTYATQKIQSRTGIKTTAVAKFDTQVIGDKLLSSAMIPYMRSRNVLIQVKGLKPNTRFYPYFDDIAIESYCTKASEIIYTPVTGSFDFETNSGINSTLDTVRRISGDNQVCLNIGDVVTGATSGKKAVVVGKERTVSNAGAISYKLFILNATGSFSSGETIKGSISGATGTFGGITTPSTFVTGSSGDLTLLFNIPNTDSVRFRTGSREFKLIDASTATGAFSSKGVSLYQASGTIETKQLNVVSTRNAEFVYNQVTDNQTIWDSSVVVSDTGWYDPLAQTFLVESKGGAFISKVDLFFASKDGNVPVSIEIREVVNGYPGKTVLPFSRVTVKSEDVMLSSTSVIDWQGISYPKYDTPTTISFPSPIYVKDKTEYALVILSDSNNYRVWISQMGDKIPDSGIAITEQPYLGVFFKSQNASTWTASQDQDLKFTIWRANFKTSAEVTGNVILTNDLLSKVTLETNPIQTLAGSSTVRVWHPNHGFVQGNSVTLSGATSTDTTITATLLNTTFLISNPTLDSFTIVAGASATSTGYIGGTALQATRNVSYETLQPTISSLGFSDTSANYSVITSEKSTALANTEESCIINDNNYYSTSKVVSNGVTGSLKVKVALSTTNPALSPIIDTHGASAIVIGNKVDSLVSIAAPLSGNTSANIAGIDNARLWAGSATSFSLTSAVTTDGSFVVGQLYTITSLGTSDFRIVGADSNTIGLSFVATKSSSNPAGIAGTGTAATNIISSAVLANQAILKRIMPGTYIELTGMSTTANNGQYMVYSVDTSGITGIVLLGAPTTSKIFVAEAANASALIYYFNSFFDEITPLGSSTFSKYTSKVITLANQSNVLRVRYAVCAPTESDVLVYYKTGTSGTNLSAVNWTLLPPDKTMPKTSIGSNTFYDVDYTKELAIGFDILTVKLVMKSTNTAAVPRVKDLRIIACAA